MTASERRRRERKRTIQGLLVALVVSLMLHQLTVTVVDQFVDFKLPESREPHEVVLRDERVKKEKAEEPPKEAPPPAPVKQAVKPQKPKSKTPLAKQKTPSPTPAKEPSALATAPAEPVPEASTEPPTTNDAPPPEVNTKLSWSAFEQIMGPALQTARQAYVEESMHKRRTSMQFGTLSKKTAKALRTNTSWVAVGNQEPLGNRAPLFYNYLAASHEKIHTYFADSFLSSLNSLDPSDPLNDFSLMAKIEFEILSSGKINEVRVIKTSGSSVFDAAAVDSLYRASPFGPPPSNILSWNDRVYFRWGFYRNRRKCGVFNAEPYMLRAPGAAPEPIESDRYMITDG